MAENKNHRYGSFDYKVINKNIRDVLDNRSRLDNGVQVAMPFIKATTTIRHDYLGINENNMGFTLGLHGIDQDVEYRDMYSSRNDTAPLLGYTYRPDGTTKLVYATNTQFDQIQTEVEQLFDRRASLVTYPEDSKFVRIPPPGITSVTIGRAKNGLLASAKLEITVPSLIQMECLHRTFLVPGIGMVLEWGQQFAVESTQTTTGGELSDISNALFPWKNRSELLRVLTRLARREVGLDEIMEKYVYPTNGQYMWMFGRVANFNINSNSDGSFKVSVKIVGPSEDAWAYDTRTTVVPKKDASSPYICSSDTHSVYSYFTNTAINGLNFKTLLDRVRNGEILKDWQNHVIYFEKGNQQAEGNPKPDTSTATINQKNFGQSDEAYFITWRFFVNVVVNDTEYGIKAILKKAGIDDQKLSTIGFLLPYANGSNRQNTNIGKLPYIDDPRESYVGMNKFLRSVDPSTMIIVNETAVSLAEKNEQYKIPAVGINLFKDDDEAQKFKTPGALGLFDKSVTSDINNLDKGFLSTGVWLNHKAVIESMISNADTIMRGVSNLLEKMNAASGTYWQLTLDQIEGDEVVAHPHSYMVVDVNWRDSSENAVANFIDNVHTFNKYIRRRTDGSLVGSELIDCSIDLSLPKRLFSQIATLGLLSPSEIDAATSGSSTVDALEKQSSIKISEPNDTLAKMFGITSLSTKNNDGSLPDLTILPVDESQRQFKTCGGANVQTTAATAGQGYQVNGINLNELPKTKPELDLLYSSSLGKVNSDICRQCENCNEKVSATESFPPNANVNSAAATLLSREEGLPRGGKAYYDPPSQTTLVSIGYGHQIKDNEYAQGYIQAGNERVEIRGERGIDTVMTKEQARKLLEQDIVRYVNAARTPLGAAWNKLSVNQQVALISYAYNTGSTSSLVRAGILNAIDQNDAAGAAAIIRDRGIRTANGQVLQVLVQRRSREAALFAANPIGNGPTQPNQPPQQKLPQSQFCIDNKTECDKCKKHQEVVRQLDEVNKITTNVEVAIRNFPGLQNVFRYVEVLPDYMIASITSTANGNNSNAFGASPGTLSIAGDLVMPGINGIRVGELFWIDRIPAFYKAYGAFQVIGIEDTIGIEGWKTKIHARFNYLGTKWKQAMDVRLRGVSQ